MRVFEIELAVQEWKKKLQRFKQLEPGDIDELESHLIESIDAQLEQGVSEEEAFLKAVTKIESGFDEVLTEYTYSSSNHEPSSKWFSSYWVPSLLPNVLKITIRNFKRQPGYSFINISGLAIGMACCFIIYLFVQNELSYDGFHEHSERIYRVDQTLIWADFEGYFGSTGPGVASTLTRDFPEIEQAVRIQSQNDGLITIERTSSEPIYFEEPNILSADSTIFNVFTLEFVEGSPNGALNNPYSVVITEETRARYFLEETGLGKSILVGNPGEEIAYQITGVVKSMPDNSHFSFDLLTSLNSNPWVERRASTWSWTTFVTYLLLEENADSKLLQEKIDNKVTEYAAMNIYPLFGVDNESAASNPRNYELFLTPLTQIQLNINDSGNRFGPVGDIFYIYLFSSIALLIIGLASINFMNLASARSVQRAKEVGIRKTLGSFKSTLIVQFLAESILFSFIALVIALGILFISIDPFNQVAGLNLQFTDIFQPINLLMIIVFTVMIGLFAGLYPAFYLTSFNPIEAFKGKTAAINSNRLSFNGLRDSLVVVQFGISIMLISCSVLIQNQIEFLQNTSLGFDKENVLIIQNIEKLGDQSETFRQLIESEPNVLQVGGSYGVPPYIWNEDFALVYGGDTETPLNSLNIDSDFFEALDFELIKGRSFEGNSTANANYVIVNEEAVSQLPWSSTLQRGEDFPLGESFYFGGSEKPFEIIGVVKNFNSNSLRYEIPPFAMFHESSATWKGENRYLSAKISPNSTISDLLVSIEERWSLLTNGLPFEYTFLDESLQEQYEAEERIGTVVNIFTALAIFIAILGLLGLISFAIEKRTKEIGVRKVMGASSGRIVYLLSKDTLKLVVISLVVSIPVSFYLMQLWLQNFAYQVPIDISIFLVAGTIAIALAWLAVSFQTIKAASQNPVKSLRSE